MMGLQEVSAREAPARPGADEAERADRAALRRIRDGEHDALAALYDRHARAALGVARRAVSSETAAEDVVQESFEALWRRAHQYDPTRGSVRSWLLGIVRHRAIDARRRDAVRPQLAFHQPPAETRDLVDGPEILLQRSDGASRIRAAIAGLPDGQAHAIALAFYAGLSQSEIATHLSLPLGTVKSRIRLGLGRLATGIEQEAVA